MKRVIAAITLSAALATTGCAHKQLTNQQAAKYAVVGGTAVLAVGLTLYFGYHQTVDPPSGTYQPQ